MFRLSTVESFFGAAAFIIAACGRSYESTTTQPRTVVDELPPIHIQSRLVQLRAVP